MLNSVSRCESVNSQPKTKNLDNPHFFVGRYLNNNLQLKELPKGVLERLFCLSVLLFYTSQKT